MSLETLLKAAEFLENNHFTNSKNTDGNQDTNQQTYVNSIGCHLKIDHTYSSSVPSSTTVASEFLINGGRAKLGNRQLNQHIGGRIKSASFSVSNSNSISNYQQSRATIRRNRNLTCSDKVAISEATSRHRELHKTLEKNRRAHLRSCFEQLKLELPKTDYAEKKYSHINIIHYAIRYIHQLQKMESDRKEELKKLNQIRNENEVSLFNLKQQIINDLNAIKINQLPNSTNQSNNSSLENLSNEDLTEDKRFNSIRSQKEIDELLEQVEQSLLCASENGSETLTSTHAIDQLSNSDEPDDYDDGSETASASGQIGAKNAMKTIGIHKEELKNLLNQRFQSHKRNGLKIFYEITDFDQLLEQWDRNNRTELNLLKITRKKVKGCYLLKRLIIL